MKKIIFTVVFLVFGISNACGPHYDYSDLYFNLFRQDIIQNKEYTAFLLDIDNSTYWDNSSWDYTEDEDENIKLGDENIEDWQKYFKGDLNYEQTYNLIYKVDVDDLIKFIKNKKSKNELLKKLQPNFYKKFKEGIDYLVHAKDKQHIRIDDDENPTIVRDDSFLSKTEKAYHSVKNKNIKIRYGYQMVRFLHYDHQREKAEKYFHKYVSPLNIKNVVYYMAMDQYAGALIGLKRDKEAYKLFFKVLVHKKDNKRGTYNSMRMTQETFESLMSSAKNTKEKEMLYFLLSFNGFSNPLGAMEKIMAINPNSELLTVLEARAINQLERQLMSKVYRNRKRMQKAPNFEVKTPTMEYKTTKISGWQKFLNFFRRIFGNNEVKPEQIVTKTKVDFKNKKNKKELLPDTGDDTYCYYASHLERKLEPKQLSEIIKFTKKMIPKSKDSFWKISLAYLQLLKRDYKESTRILRTLKTDNEEYQLEIKKLLMLSDILSRDSINEEFENTFFKENSDLFVKKESSYEREEYSDLEQFVSEVIANRYYVQGDLAKAYLMTNELSDIDLFPYLDLTKSLHQFYKKENKNEFENKLLMPKINIKNPEGLFSMIYGDHEMRVANFKKAKEHYNLATKSSYYHWYYKKNYPMNDNYDSISGSIFSDNFDFIPEYMNKKELAEVCIKLNSIGKGKGEDASKANYCIGSLLQATSKEGDYRNLFVRDKNTEEGPKFDFYPSDMKLQFNYKNRYERNNFYLNYDNYKLIYSIYKKALDKTTNKDRKVEILFEMGCLERSEFFQWVADNYPPGVLDRYAYDGKYKKNIDELAKHQRNKFRKYWGIIKEKYSKDKYAHMLHGSHCSYYYDFIYD